jgi:hypothetical protein
MFAERHKCIGANVLHRDLAGDQTTKACYLPTAGISIINLLVIDYIAASADVVLNVCTADDSSGTNAATLSENVPMWVEGTRQDDGKALTIAYADYAPTANYTAIIQVPAIIVPDGKYLGCYLTAGNASNLLNVIAIEETYYHG